LPAVANRENVGPEADLFSVGVAMLVLSLRQQGVRSEATAFLSFLNDNYADVNRKTKTVEQANHAIEHYLDTSLSLAANECDIAAMRIIKEAIALSTVNFINPREQLIPVLERLRDSF
jgi:N-acetylglucosamine kinase-like BadF-type ATPase